MSGTNWRKWATTTHGPAELIAASFAFWWGFWTLSPGWNMFGTSPTYTLMAILAPDYVWGGVLMAYAYFFRHNKMSPTQEGHQRLEVIAENTQLGAGYSIAMRALEIRGAW